MKEIKRNPPSKCFL